MDGSRMFGIMRFGEADFKAKICATSPDSEWAGIAVKMRC
jgi:hypothetical protein